MKMNPVLSDLITDLYWVAAEEGGIGIVDLIEAELDNILEDFEGSLADPDTAIDVDKSMYIRAAASLVAQYIGSRLSEIRAEALGVENG